MNVLSRLRNARYRCSASLSRFVRVAGDLAASARSNAAAISSFSAVHSASHGRTTTGSTSSMILSGPCSAPRAGALAGIQPPLEQRPEDRRVDLRPVEFRCCQHGIDVGPLQRERRVVVEQPAVEPVDRLDADQASLRHPPEQRAGKLRETVRHAPRLFQHSREHVAGQQAHVVGEHAEHQPVDEVRHHVRVVAAFPERLRERRERLRRLLGERLPRLARPQPLRVRERPLEPVARRGVGQVVEAELVRLADAVGPVGADPEPLHVRDDQQRRVLQRQRVQAELAEGGVEVRPLALVLPCEVVALPDIGPAVAARVLAGAPLEAVRLAGRVRLGPASARRAAGTGR